MLKTHCLSDKTLNDFFCYFIYSFIKFKVNHIKIILKKYTYIEIIFLIDNININIEKVVYDIPKMFNKKIKKVYQNSFVTYLLFHEMQTIICIVKKTVNNLICYDQYLKCQPDISLSTINKEIIWNILCCSVKKIPIFFLLFCNTKIHIIISDKSKYLLNKVACINSLSYKGIIDRIYCGFKLEKGYDIFIKKILNGSSKTIIYGFKTYKYNNIYIYINNFYYINNKVIKKIKSLFLNFSYFFKTYTLFIFISFKSKSFMYNFNKNIENQLQFIATIIYNILEV